MKLNNAGEDIWQRAQNANQKFEWNTQTQDADGTQAMSVLYKTLLEPVSEKKNNKFHGWG